jgi:hypothetical protein
MMDGLLEKKQEELAESYFIFSRTGIMTVALFCLWSPSLTLQNLCLK